MFENHRFSSLVEENRPTGEVVATNRFLVWARGLEEAPVGGTVMFEDGSKGLIREVDRDSVTILNLSAEEAVIGSLIVLEDTKLTCGVGEGLIGRMISVLGEPLDGHGPINMTARGDVFAEAPGVMERDILNQQLVCGMDMVDLLFPIVLGQRIAVMGDSKTGKSGFLARLAASQVGSDRVIVQVLIGKRKADVATLMSSLEASGAIKQTVVVVANIFDSLAQAYLAPYVGCAIAENLWHQGRDVVVIYDDLTSHAKVYRELSLLAHASPGRDSYPGDMFYAHSALLERSGKLAKNSKTLTALPVVLTPNNDITAYLPTNIMSITDGQLVMDPALISQGIQPPVNIGLSVSRVGGRAQGSAQKGLAGRLFKKLADFRQAAEFAHFGSELALGSRADLELGKLVYAVFNQRTSELYSLAEQQLLFETILASGGKQAINVETLKRQVRELAKSAGDEDYQSLVNQLIRDNTLQAAK